MASLELPFATQEGKSRSLQNSRESLVNMYCEIETSGKRRLIRRQRAGLRQVYAVAGAKRGIEKYRDTHYLVIDNQFYSFDGTTLTAIGIAPGVADRCTIVFDDNGKALVSDGTGASTWDGVSLALVPATPPTDVGPVAVLSGFGIYTVPGEEQFYVSAVNDFTTWDALDFASAESNPDKLLRAFTDHNELWLFGSKSIEIWSLSGGTDFPFTPLVNAHLERGCQAAYSVAKDDNSIFWLGDDGVVYRADGYRPTRVSTHTVEREIADVPAATRAEAEAFFYTQGGHKFYTLRFPGELTEQYDIATGLWVKATTFPLDDWKIGGSAGGTTDYVLTDAGICVLDDTLNTDEGGVMQRQAISAPLYDGGKRIVVRSYRLDVEVGRAAIGVPDPQVSLRVALDGETFGNSLARSLGSTGDYKRRVVWRNLGIGEKPVFEFTVTDDVNFSVTGGDGSVFVASS